jgi:hypothetical protein
MRLRFFCAVMIEHGRVGFDARATDSSRQRVSLPRAWPAVFNAVAMRRRLCPAAPSDFGTYSVRSLR